MKNIYIVVTVVQKYLYIHSSKPYDVLPPKLEVGTKKMPFSGCKGYAGHEAYRFVVKGNPNL